MYCPDCKTELVCGCPSCISNKTKGNHMIILEDGFEGCPECGLVKHIEDWFTLSNEQFDSSRTRDNKEILSILTKMLEKHPTMRFNQALYTLEAIQRLGNSYYEEPSVTLRRVKTAAKNLYLT